MLILVAITRALANECSQFTCQLRPLKTVLRRRITGSREEMLDRSFARIRLPSYSKAPEFLFARRSEIFPSATFFAKASGLRCDSKNVNYQDSSGQRMV